MSDKRPFLLIDIKSKVVRFKVKEYKSDIDAITKNPDFDFIIDLKKIVSEFGYEVVRR